jgi:hypothetical protein
MHGPVVFLFGKENTPMKSLKLGYVVLALAFLPALRASEKEDPMVGKWEGSAHVVVEWCAQSELFVSIDIAADGKVTGKVGDSVLVDGQLRKKNAWFGSKSEDRTTHIIKANLKGDIVNAEGIVRDEVFIHVRFENHGMSGSVGTSGAKAGGKEKMALTAYPLRLSKVE